MKKRETTAYHEAGHAVAAFLNGFEIEFATIKRCGDAAGMVKALPKGKLDLRNGSPHMRAKIESCLIMTLAGDAAQRKFAPRSSRNWQTSSDRESATDMALAVCGTGESATAYIAWLAIVTRDLIQSRWQSVERVAAALLEKETLSGQEVREAIIGQRRKITVVD